MDHDTGVHDLHWTPVIKYGQTSGVSWILLTAAAGLGDSVLVPTETSQE